ncbi:MAG: Fur family transcriptional regulator [Ornithinimicrobium sp.]|uniref:Fur family transcriptional regulator n=1 Tax=Ornithinimicrobium sp. TaxID=1977084 RepID=UPI003D9B2D9C
MSVNGDAGPVEPAEVQQRLRAAGLRLTGPRRRVLAALARVGHATPEQLSGALERDGEGELPASTIYRNLESLAGVGLVRHTHLDHGAPSYHLDAHGEHLHLVCRQCGRVLEADPAMAGELARNLRARHGFEPEVTHMAIHGRCARCADVPPPAAPDTAHERNA